MENRQVRDGKGLTTLLRTVLLPAATLPAGETTAAAMVTGKPAFGSKSGGPVVAMEGLEGPMRRYVAAHSLWSLYQSIEHVPEAMNSQVTNSRLIMTIPPSPPSLV